MSEDLHCTTSPSAADSLDLHNLWWQKQSTGLVRHDPDLLVLHRAAETCGDYGWGTLFYSKSREGYKNRVGTLPEKRAATFDLDVMAQLQFARAGDLIIAANANSIVPGHLVIYPHEKHDELTFADIRDMCRLAAEQRQWTFIHNMERAAASIVDWAHYQAYPWDFPLAQEASELIFQASDFKLSRLADAYPAYTLLVSAENEKAMAAWLFEMLRALAAGSKTSAGQRIPCNIVWRGRRAWLIPRSLSQTSLAATYIGALELGGLFCLPNADSLRQYLPDALRAEVRQAGVAGEPEMREWCDESAREIAGRLSLSDWES